MGKNIWKIQAKKFQKIAFTFFLSITKSLPRSKLLRTPRQNKKIFLKIQNQFKQSTSIKQHQTPRSFKVPQCLNLALHKLQSVSISSTRYIASTIFKAMQDLGTSHAVIIQHENTNFSHLIIGKRIKCKGTDFESSYV